MVILDVSEVVENALYCIHWKGCKKNSLDEMAEKLTNVEYLTEHFTQNAEKLKFYNKNVLNAVVTTRTDISNVLKRFYSCAREKENNQLDSIFKPLHDVSAFNHPRIDTDYKSYGIKAGWIRIYAIRIDDNCYVITGYGIKLDKKMQDDPVLVNELKKLQTASDYLKSEGFL